MSRLVAWIVGLTTALAVASSPAFARTPHTHVRKSCCLVPAGTVVQVELTDQVSTKVKKPGDRFALRLSAPLIVNGRILLRAGTPGVGQVVESARPGIGGKPAELVLAARYLTRRRVRVPLEGLQLAAAGHDNSRTAQIVGLSGFAFAPLGFAGLAVKGGDMTFASGTSATAKVTSDIVLPSLGDAPANAATPTAVALRASVESGPVLAGATVIPPPPPGQGQVIFFRKKSLTSIGQWFRVREGDKTVGKLSNGVYFVHVTAPGEHTYSAAFEPELKDKLKIEVDPGETYFVQGTTTVGLVVGAADLSPSTRADFQKASKHLKPTAQQKDGAEDKDAGGKNADSGQGAAAPTPPSANSAPHTSGPDAGPTRN
jgi:hypothetical protein